MFSNVYKFYDLFVELPYLTFEENQKVVTEYNGMIYMLQEDFRDCFPINNIECKYDNLRFHYIDTISTIAQEIHTYVTKHLDNYINGKEIKVDENN